MHKLCYVTGVRRPRDLVSKGPQAGEGGRCLTGSSEMDRGGSAVSTKGNCAPLVCILELPGDPIGSQTLLFPTQMVHSH